MSPPAGFFLWRFCGGDLSNIYPYFTYFFMHDPFSFFWRTW